MMEDYLTADRIANSILQRSSFKGSYLIVEGNNDFSLYRKFTTDTFCKVEIGFGWKNVIDVISELRKRGYEDAIGIVDSDFRRINNDELNIPNIFFTDFHDIEVMVFLSDAFDTVISHHSNPKKIEAFKKENDNKELRDIFLSLALPLGYLKWANQKNNWELIFKPEKPDGNPLSISDFIPVATLKFTSFEDMTQAVINYSSGKSKLKVSKSEIVRITKKLISDAHSILQLCNGHDIAHIVCLSLRKKTSNLSANAVKVEQLERELIFAYDSRHFEQTDLYKNIKGWEKLRGKQVFKF